MAILCTSQSTVLIVYLFCLTTYVFTCTRVSTVVKALVSETDFINQSMFNNIYIRLSAFKI